MRILFLECDGVLHPARATSRFVRSVPLKQAVQQAWLFRWAWILDELLNGQPDIGIVLHSNWRYLATNQELQSFLGPLARRFVGTVPITPAGNRWAGIQEVIAINHLRDYRILDCLPAAFPAALPELIVCHPEIGLQAYSVRRQIRNWANLDQHALPQNG